jgi:hypothetical protein
MKQAKQVYIHFTDSKGALGIYKSKELWSSSFIEGVYAVAVGAPSVPEVQQTRLGRAKSRDVAVLFTTTELPNYCYPEECVWIAEKIPIKVVNILPTKNALKYLNGETPSIGSNFAQRLAIPTKEIPEPENPPDWLFKENVKNLLNYLLIG